MYPIVHLFWISAVPYSDWYFPGIPTLRLFDRVDAAFLFPASSGSAATRCCPVAPCAERWHTELLSPNQATMRRSQLQVAAVMTPWTIAVTVHPVPDTEAPVVRLPVPASAIGVVMVDAIWLGIAMLLFAPATMDSPNDA